MMTVIAHEEQFQVSSGGCGRSRESKEEDDRAEQRRAKQIWGKHFKAHGSGCVIILETELRDLSPGYLETS
jgi:hypothetical protein